MERICNKKDFVLDRETAEKGRNRLTVTVTVYIHMGACVCLRENESIFNDVGATEGGDDDDGVVLRNVISLLIPHLHG